MKAGGGLRLKLVRIGLRRWVKAYGGMPTSQTRARFRFIEKLVPRPPARARTISIEGDEVRAELVSMPASRSSHHVLYLHGGAFQVGSPRTYRHFTWRVAEAMQAQVLVMDYRLAPKHTFPAPLEDALAGYRWLLDKGGTPGRTVFIGDSAGGGLVLAALLKARDIGLPLPAAAAVISPWTDLAATGQSLTRNAAADPMIRAEFVPAYARQYLAGADPRNPYASPLYGDSAGLPPTLFQVGSDEVLLDDTVRMAERMRAAGCEVEVQIWPHMPHVWHLLAPVLPQARAAIRDMAAFLLPRMVGEKINRDQRVPKRAGGL